jgi:UPF0755 protein
VVNKKIIFFFIFLIFCFLLLSYTTNKNNNHKEVVFTIYQGETFKEISINLNKENLISNRLSFALRSIVSGKRKRIQAGTYILNTSMSEKQILEKIYRGESALKKITIIEGWNISKILEYIEKIGLNKESFENLVYSEKYNEMNFLKDKPIDMSLEGYLFPDTYHMSYSFSEKDLVDKMLLNFNEKLDSSLREEIKKQNKNIFDIIIMASIIEKEVRDYGDKQIVSGILWKRIDMGIPLQVDATIVYITGKTTTKISIEETKIKSPYNTYLNKGLPVGPISNPGIESIRAAIYPQKTNYLFYLSTFDGETIFSRNFQEHINAKNKYLK